MSSDHDHYSDLLSNPHSPLPSPHSPLPIPHSPLPLVVPDLPGSYSPLASLNSNDIDHIINEYNLSPGAFLDEVNYLHDLPPVPSPPHVPAGEQDPVNVSLGEMQGHVLSNANCIIQQSIVHIAGATDKEAVVTELPSRTELICPEVTELVDDGPEKRTSQRSQPAASSEPAPAVANIEEACCEISSLKVFRDTKTGVQYTDVRGEPIAEGAFGAVHEVCNSRGERVALKVPKPNAKMALIRKEARFLSRVQGHDNVVKFHGVVEDERGPCLLMHLYQPRDFSALLINRAPLPVAEIRFFGKQLVAGLSYIHEAGIRHCDLKPENVLVDKGMQLKIADFGLAEESSALSKRKAGTRGYWAPEVLEGKEHTNKIDVFSIGIMFYMMFARIRPYFTAGDVVRRPPEDYLESVAPSEDARDLLERTLKVDADQRIELPKLAVHMFLCRGFCPKSLPDTAFDEAPVFDNDSAEKHARSSENNGEDSGALSRRKRRAKRVEVKDYESRVNQVSQVAAGGVTAKGKEAVRGYRSDTKPGAL